MLFCTCLAVLVVTLKVRIMLSARQLEIFIIYQVFIFDTEVEDETFQPLEQQKNDNKKYNGLGFIPDYDGYIS
jgi:glycerol-3-phosphate responsive antiterminator